jgi:hypothetical protein
VKQPKQQHKAEDIDAMSLTNIMNDKPHDTE